MAIAPDELLEILSDKRLIELRRQADTSIFVKKDLECFKMPAGLDPDTAWKVLTAIRYQTASLLPFETYQDIGYTTETWYTFPRSMFINLKKLEVLCSQGSFIDVTLNSLISSFPVQKLLEKELSHAFQIESMAIDATRIHAVFMGETTEAQGVDRIIKNFQRLVFGLDSYKDRAVTQGLIEELFYKLIDGAESFDPPRRTSRSYKPFPKSRYHDRRETLSAICSLADIDNDPLLHPILRVICISWFMWDFEAVPRFNALIEILLRHILFKRWELPSLCWVPFCDNGKYIGSDVYFDALHDCGYGLDSTYLFCKIVEYLLEGVEEVAGIADRATSLSREINEAFSEELNPRQRSILLNMLLAPESVLRIEPHRQAYRITYPTARNDFYDLVAKGFLQKGQEGRAFVFKATPKLLELKPGSRSETRCTNANP